jgi:hypothetical protein
VKLLLTGPQGAGKTTAASSSRGIDGDVFRRFVVSGRVGLTSSPGRRRWRSRRSTTASSSLFPGEDRLFAEGLDNGDLTPEQTAAAILRG